MGITGLLPYLKKASHPTSIKEFKGCTVAVDSYCWLHRGAYTCAEKLALGEDTDQFVYYCMKYVNNLLSFDIKPIMVFDGCRLPSKQDVEKARRERRAMNRKKAAQLLLEGKKSEARDSLVQCIDITPQMALQLMNACRAKGVDCIVAPYEADAQLAYLCKIGIAQCVITEDSDLVLFGCDKIMFKMDFAGNGMLVDKRELNKAMGLPPEIYTFDKFRYACILSGCDYLPNLPGIGLVKATKLFRLSRQSDIATLIRKIPTILGMSSLQVPVDYVDGFFRADNSFLYQLVFDPLKRKLVPLNPYPDGVDPSDYYYAGPYLDNEKAYQIALGNINVNTGEKIADFNPDTDKPKSSNWNQEAPPARHLHSIWSWSYRPKSEPFVASYDPKPIVQPNTRGKEVVVEMPALSKKLQAFRRKRMATVDDTPEEDVMNLYTQSEDNDCIDGATGECPQSPSPIKKRSCVVMDASPEIKRSLNRSNPDTSHQQIMEKRFDGADGGGKHDGDVLTEIELNTALENGFTVEKLNDSFKSSPPDGLKSPIFRSRIVSPSKRSRSEKENADLRQTPYELEARDEGKPTTECVELAADIEEPNSSAAKSPEKKPRNLFAALSPEKKPPRNVFAIGSGASTRPRFSINATRTASAAKPVSDVRSRFFVHKGSRRETEFFKELKKEHIAVETSAADVESKSESETESDACDVSSKTSPIITPKVSGRGHQNLEVDRVSNVEAPCPSPYQAFGFTKLLNDRTRDKLNNNSDTRINHSNSTLNKPFKTVTQTSSTSNITTSWSQPFGQSAVTSSSKRTDRDSSPNVSFDVTCTISSDEDEDKNEESVGSASRRDLARNLSKSFTDVSSALGRHDNASVRLNNSDVGVYSSQSSTPPSRALSAGSAQQQWSASSSSSGSAVAKLARALASAEKSSSAAKTPAAANGCRSSGLSKVKRTSSSTSNSSSSNTNTKQSGISKYFNAAFAFNKRSNSEAVL